MGEENSDGLKVCDANCQSLAKNRAQRRISMVICNENVARNQGRFFTDPIWPVDDTAPTRGTRGRRD